MVAVTLKVVGLIAFAVLGAFWWIKKPEMK